MQLMEDIKTEKFELLDYTHHLSSGFKSVFSQDSFDFLLQIRQAMGGGGFTAWSGIPRLIEEFSPLPTFEGDNTVMLQQTCNYLMK